MQQESHGKTPLDSGQQAPPAALSAPWRRVLARSINASQTGPGDTLGFLLEVLREPATRAPARLQAAPVLLPHGRDGARRKGRPLDAATLAQSRLTLAEQHLAACVLGQPLQSRKGRHYVTLNGALGDALLVDMLDTVPCFLGGLAGLHLARGAGQRLDWHWHMDAAGEQTLSPRLHPGQQLLAIGKLWYLDVQNTTLGPLHGAPAEADWLDWPALAAADSDAVASALAQSPLGARIPAPRRFPAPRVLHVEPQAVLTLHQIQVEGARQLPLAYACLAFDYAGERLPGGTDEPVVQRLREGQLLQIHRQRAAELTAIERLDQGGWCPAVDTEGLPWDVATDLSDNAWLFPGTGHAGALEVNTPARWLAQRARLLDAGFVLEYAADFPYAVVDAPAQWYVRASDRRGARFEIEIGLELEGERHNLLPAITRALDSGELDWDRATESDPTWYAPLDARRRLPVSWPELRTLLEPLRERLRQPLEHLQLPHTQAGRLDELAAALPKQGHLQAPPALREFTSRLRQAAHRAGPPVPATLQAHLRPYQHEGLRWLDALADAGIGGILADDMGLGKTLQVLAHLLSLQASGKLVDPVLVVAPTSLIPNWESESARFAPSLSQLTLSGPNRAESFAAMADHNLVLTSYALLPRDLAVLRNQPFALVVLDEAQQVKNPRTQARRAVLALKAPRRLCLSGTPLENHLGELWSQVDLAVPGLLGGEKDFQRTYRQPIEKEQDADCQQRLNQRLAPFILRRTKAQVATELPPKTEVTRRIVMQPQQRRLYEDVREELSSELAGTIARRGIEHSSIAVLDALLKLRQVCCDPRLLKNGAAHGITESAKFELLLDILPALLAEGRRVLLFSQFTEMLKLIAAELKRRHLDFVTLTGETRDRAEPVRRFQDGEVSLFLLSLKAGGVGLNLTAADAVIHYDPWWNPAAEAQASDRAHRIGQDKPVLVYRLITTGTVEERIEAMQERKAALADAVLAGGGSRERLQLDQADIDALLAPGC